MKLMASIELFVFLINVYTSTNLNSEDLDWNGLNSNIANQNDHNFESWTVCFPLTKRGYFTELNQHRSKLIIFNFIILERFQV